MARRRRLAAVAGLGCAALLLAAFGFQYLGGLAPCPMCIWQRWPHVIGVAAALGAAAFGAALFAGLGALAMLGNAGLGLFHVGVEQRWWDGPATCVAGSIEGLSTDDLLAQIMNAPVVRCDEIAWSLFGLSMAGWNALASLALAAVFALSYASSSASQYR